MATLDAASADYMRLASLEYENQALRDQIRDLTHLLQIKDAEIQVKCHLIQQKDHENAQARSRLQYFEVSLRQSALAAELEATATSSVATAAAPSNFGTGPTKNVSSTYEREALLRLSSVLGESEEPVELSSLRCAERVDGPSAEQDPETPSKGRNARTLKTPIGTPLPSPSTANSQQTASRRQAQHKPDGLAEAVEDTACAEAEMPTSLDESPLKSSPGRRAPPPALDVALEEDAPPAGAATEDNSAHEEGARASETAAATNKKLAIVDPDTGKQIQEEAPAQAPAATPSKRLAIVDPVSGKAIEVTPSTEASRVKPTLISLDAIAEGRAPKAPAPPAAGLPPPQSPAGPSAPPLTLPPVVAGAPQLGTAPPRPTAPGPFGAYPGPPGAPPLGAPSLGAPPLGAPPLGAPPLGAPSLGAPPLGPSAAPGPFGAMPGHATPGAPPLGPPRPPHSAGPGPQFPALQGLPGLPGLSGGLPLLPGLASGLGLGAPPYGPGSSGTLGPPPLLSTGLPHCPPPSHPAPLPAGAAAAAAAAAAASGGTAILQDAAPRLAVPGTTAPGTGPAEATLASGVAGCMTDPVQGGPMQLAKGALAGVHTPLGAIGEQLAVGAPPAGLPPPGAPPGGMAAEAGVPPPPTNPANVPW